MEGTMRIWPRTHIEQEIRQQRAQNHLTFAEMLEFTLHLMDLLAQSRRTDHDAGCMAGWAQVGVIYKDTSCSCSAGEWNAKIDEVLT